MKKLSFDTQALLKRFSYGEAAHPARDWFLLLSGATFLIALSIAWNVWMLRTVEEGGVIGNEEASETFDSAPVESVRAVFESRAEQKEKYRQEYRFVDPSR